MHRQDVVIHTHSRRWRRQIARLHGRQGGEAETRQILAGNAPQCRHATDTGGRRGFRGVGEGDGGPPSAGRRYCRRAGRPVGQSQIQITLNKPVVGRALCLAYEVKRVDGA